MLANLYDADNQKTSKISDLWDEKEKSLEQAGKHFGKILRNIRFDMGSTKEDFEKFKNITLEMMSDVLL